MIKIVIVTIAVICNILFIAVPTVWPIVYLKRTGKFISGFLLCWGLAFLLSFSMSVIIPGILLAMMPNQKHLILNSFPEAIVNGPVILMGWIGALIVSCIGMSFYNKSNDQD